VIIDFQVFTQPGSMPGAKKSCQKIEQQDHE